MFFKKKTQKKLSNGKKFRKKGRNTNYILSNYLFHRNLLMFPHFLHTQVPFFIFAELSLFPIHLGVDESETNISTDTYIITLIFSPINTYKYSYQYL